MRPKFHDDLWEDWEDCEKWGGFGDARTSRGFRELRKRLSGIGLLWDVCGCRTIGEKKRGFRLYFGNFRDADTTHCH